MATPQQDKKGVLLFEEEEEVDTPTGAKNDAALQNQINKYLEERASKKQNKPGKAAAGEEHTGITDDEADDEGEPDYDVASRMTLKASSEAFLEVMAEARLQYQKEQTDGGKVAAGEPATTKKP
ncbi:hypothetical protein HYH02_011158 [Chlamydomonas schloesseri]|uniref:Uncharacterized protein n=1 Tax=Chlamydomonas schloesseri TaxID=2026947 RepID=A0A835T1G6_9CHLO|nr:hypothetical protein HYH02_013706 [Chlamydomonas schloesseri]KAG2437515.1 hypothetical protein HYH02_011158 [Chlamydomonas schloesseri]|eukprot:KAG2430710.1 hypothetical protein HYH02_013706 [Chlamydomonas schloesseri]